MNIERAAQHLSRFGESQQDLAQEGYLAELRGKKAGGIFGAMLDYNRTAKAPGWRSSRSRNRNRTGWVQLDDAPKVPGLRPPLKWTDAQAKNVIERVDLNRAIDQLGSTAQQAIRFTYFEDMDKKQAAALLGLRVGRVAVCLCKARARMREFLQSGYEVQNARFDGRSKKGRAEARA